MSKLLRTLGTIVLAGGLGFLGLKYYQNRVENQKLERTSALEKLAEYHSKLNYETRVADNEYIDNIINQNLLNTANFMEEYGEKEKLFNRISSTFNFVATDAINNVENISENQEIIQRYIASEQARTRSNEYIDKGIEQIASYNPHNENKLDTIYILTDSLRGIRDTMNAESAYLESLIELTALRQDDSEARAVMSLASEMTEYKRRNMFKINYLINTLENTAQLKQEFDSYSQGIIQTQQNRYSSNLELLSKELGREITPIN
jgi:hypothetical protein